MCVSENLLCFTANYISKCTTLVNKIFLKLDKTNNTVTESVKLFDLKWKGCASFFSMWRQICLVCSTGGIRETAQHHEKLALVKGINCYQPVETFDCRSSKLSTFETLEKRRSGTISSMFESPDRSCSLTISSIHVSRDFLCSDFLSEYSRISSKFVSLEFLFGLDCVGRFAL